MTHYQPQLLPSLMLLSLVLLALLPCFKILAIHPNVYVSGLVLNPCYMAYHQVRRHRRKAPSLSWDPTRCRVSPEALFLGQEDSFACGRHRYPDTVVGNGHSLPISNPDSRRESSQVENTSSCILVGKLPVSGVLAVLVGTAHSARKGVSRHGGEEGPGRRGVCFFLVFVTFLKMMV